MWLTLIQLTYILGITTLLTTANGPQLPLQDFRQQPSGKGAVVAAILNPYPYPLKPVPIVVGFFLFFFSFIFLYTHH